MLQSASTTRTAAANLTKSRSAHTTQKSATKQDAKAMYLPVTVQVTPAAAEAMPATYPKSNALQRTASTTMTVNVKQRQLKFLPARPAAAVKPNVTPLKRNKTQRGVIFHSSNFILDNFIFLCYYVLW